MRRSWNWSIWAGFAVALAATFSYLTLFIRFPLTRDFPWVNYLLFAVAGLLLARGLYRAFALPERYRGKVSGTILSTISLALFGLFTWGTIAAGGSLPSGRTALPVGQPAPQFSLPDIEGRTSTLAQLGTGKRAVLLIFYRGYW